MWTNKNRARYDRSKLRYPSDLTDAEWGLVEPLIPPGKTGGGKRTVNIREVVNGLMYILSTGCQWRAIPKDLPPKNSVYDYFDLWTYDGTLERIHHALYEQCRDREQRQASPTAAIIDSQSVKSAEKGGRALIARVRCGQEDQGQEAAHSCRHIRPAAPRHRSSGRHSRSRWRRSRHGDTVRQRLFAAIGVLTLAPIISAMWRRARPRTGLSPCGLQKAVMMLRRVICVD